MFHWVGTSDISFHVVLVPPFYVNSFFCVMIVCFGPVFSVSPCTVNHPLLDEPRHYRNDGAVKNCDHTLNITPKKKWDTLRSPFLPPLTPIVLPPLWCMLRTLQITQLVCDFLGKGLSHSTANSSICHILREPEYQQQEPFFLIFMEVIDLLALKYQPNKETITQATGMRTKSCLDL